VWAIADSKRQGYLGFKEFITAMQVLALCVDSHSPLIVNFLPYKLQIILCISLCSWSLWLKLAMLWQVISQMLTVSYAASTITIQYASNVSCHMTATTKITTAQFQTSCDRLYESSLLHLSSTHDNIVPNRSKMWKICKYVINSNDNIWSSLID